MSRTVLTGINAHALILSPTAGVHQSGSRLRDGGLAVIEVGILIAAIVGMYMVRMLTFYRHQAGSIPHPATQRLARPTADPTYLESRTHAGPLRNAVSTEGAEADVGAFFLK